MNETSERPPKSSEFFWQVPGTLVTLVLSILAAFVVLVVMSVLNPHFSARDILRRAKVGDVVYQVVKIHRPPLKPFIYEDWAKIEYRKNSNIKFAKLKFSETYRNKGIAQYEDGEVIAIRVIGGKKVSTYRPELNLGAKRTLKGSPDLVVLPFLVMARFEASGRPGHVGISYDRLLKRSGFRKVGQAEIGSFDTDVFEQRSATDGEIKDIVYVEEETDLVRRWETWKVGPKGGKQLKLRMDFTTYKILSPDKTPSNLFSYKPTHDISMEQAKDLSFQDELLDPFQEVYFSDHFLETIRRIPFPIYVLRENPLGLRLRTIELYPKVANGVARIIYEGDEGPLTIYIGRDLPLSTFIPYFQDVLTPISEKTQKIKIENFSKKRKDKVEINAFEVPKDLVEASRTQANIAELSIGGVSIVLVSDPSAAWEGHELNQDKFEILGKDQLVKAAKSLVELDEEDPNSVEQIIAEARLKHIEILDRSDAFAELIRTVKKAPFTLYGLEQGVKGLQFLGLNGSSGLAPDIDDISFLYRAQDNREVRVYTSSSKNTNLKYLQPVPPDDLKKINKKRTSKISIGKKEVKVELRFAEDPADTRRILLTSMNGVGITMFTTNFNDLEFLEIATNLTPLTVEKVMGQLPDTPLYRKRDPSTVK